MKIKLFSIFCALLFIPSIAFAQVNDDEVDFSVYTGKPMGYFQGKVIAVIGDRIEDDPYLSAFDQFSQELRIRILNGPDKGQELSLSYVPGSIGQAEQNMRVGDKVLLAKTDVTSEESYYIHDRYRLGGLRWLFVLFFALVIFFAGWKGVRSILGLAFTLVVIMWYIVPRILAGGNPFLVFIIGSLFIALVSIYLGHGFNRRTSVAVASTVVTILISIGLAMVAVAWTKIFGLGSEEAFYLQVGELGSFNLRGLLLGGIIIGVLGVLDDITTAQTATVAQIHRADPTLSFRELAKRGFHVGHEHVISLVNTLALAYVGASFPLLLLFLQTEIPWWIALNSERVIEEVVRTLVGSSALVIAVPISTYLAAYIFYRYGVGKFKEDEVTHAGHQH